MLLSAVSVVVVTQSSSEIPEGLMNNSVYGEILHFVLYNSVFFWKIFTSLTSREYNGAKRNGSFMTCFKVIIFLLCDYVLIGKFILNRVILSVRLIQHAPQ